MRRVVVTERLTLDGVMQAPSPPERTTEVLNVQRYVASTTLTEPLPWRNSALLDGDAAEAVVLLNQHPGKNIVITGSMSQMPVLVAGGVVDEYRLFIYPVVLPVVLGRGRRLFADAAGVPRLRLVEARPFRSGIVLLGYRTAGERDEPT